MKRFAIIICLLSLFIYSPPVFATSFDFSGYLTNHNDIAMFSFNLDNDASNVRIWTDSFNSGSNFDPITALWTDSGYLIAENDDDPTINPATQSIWDSGISLSGLRAGDYLFTLASYNNFASGTTLAEGFIHDNDSPIAMENWWIGAPGNYHVVFDGVDSATSPNPVPEPTTMVLFGVGSLCFAAVSRKKSRK